MHKRIAFVILFLSYFQYHVYSQNLKTCTYSGYITPTEFISTCGLDKKGQTNVDIAIIDSLLLEIGLKKNFVIKECQNINSSSAAMIDPFYGYMERYVTYPKNLLQNWKNYNSINWIYFGQLMHAIGHQIYRHALIEGIDNHNEELIADEFSGYILAKMGASHKESLSSANFAKSEALINNLFPDFHSRIEATTNGWKKFNNGISSLEFLSAFLHINKDLGKVSSQQDMSIENRHAMYHSATDALEEKDYDKAQFYYQELLSNGINFLTKTHQQLIFKNLALCHYYKKEYKMASDYLKIAIKLDPLDTDSMLKEAEIRLDEGNYTECIDLLKSVLRLTPSNPILYRKLAEVSELKGDVVYAIKAYSRALILEPKLINVRINLANVYINEGNDMTLIINTLDKSQNQRKELKRIENVRHGLFQKAQNVLEEGLAINPNSRLLVNELLILYTELGDGKNARRMKKLLKN